jgi:hypothetical protein
MINIIDDFLDASLYQEVYRELIENEFIEVDTGDKSFWVQSSNLKFDEFIINKISKLERVQRRNILSFFRVATAEVDTDWRIHSDAIINGETPDRALVLYLSPSSMNGLHGTAFWKHKTIGYFLPQDVSSEEYDKILKEDSESLDKWVLHSVIGYKENRAVCYPGNYFHSKYPNIGWEEGRIVYVMFYK